MDKSGRYFFRIPSPDVIPSSEMQIHPLRIDIDLSRFVLVCGEFFLASRESFFTGRQFYHWSRIFLPVEKFLTGREFFGRSSVFCFFGRDNLIGECHGSPVNSRGPK